MPVLVPPNEARRALVAEEALVHTGAEVRTSLDGLARIASRVFDTRFAAITVVDGGHVEFVGKAGHIPVERLKRGQFFCGQTVATREGLAVADARRDPRFHQMRLVEREHGIRFYAGAPVRDAAGLAIGTICVFDTDARETPSQFELETLFELAAQVATHLDPTTPASPRPTGPMTPAAGESRLPSLDTPVSTPAVPHGELLAAVAELVTAEPERLQQHLEAHPAPVYVKDELGAFVLVNEAAAELFGYDAASLLGRLEADLLDPRDDTGGFERVSTTVAPPRELAATHDEEIIDARGRRRFFRVTRHLIERDDVRWTLSFAHETTKLRRYEAFAREHATLLQAAGRDTPDALLFEKVARFVATHLDASAVALWTRDAHGLRYAGGTGLGASVVDALRAGVRADALLEHVDPSASVLHNGPLRAGHGVSAYEGLALDGRLGTYLALPIRSAEGRAVGVLDVLLPQLAPANVEQQEVALAAVAIAGLAVEHKRRARQITYQQFNDRLTRLPNREGFLERLTALLAHASRSGETLAVLVTDIDDFRQVNDRYGQQVGDAILQELAVRLDGCLRDTDSLARISADEFALVLTGLTDPHGAATVARKLSAALERPFEVAGEQIDVRATVGISLYPSDAADARSLLDRAYSALHRAKLEARGAFRYFSPDRHAEAIERYELLGDLRRAIGGDELWLAMQSQIELGTGRQIGFEFLLRWNHPTRGPVSPGVFIPIAEESQLIVPLGEWVLHEACRRIAAWIGEHGEDGTRFSVNVAAAQFACPDFVEQVRRALSVHRVHPRLLELEVTESMVVEDIDATIAMIDELRAMGVKIAIDDFGTGHAGFAYLMQLPADRLKLDRMFMNDLVDEHGRMRRGAQVVKGIIDLAHLLDMEVVAEGVELPEQREFLMRVGCDHVQGFLYGHPQ